MVEKPKHVEAGMTPFEYASAERKGKLEKQNLAELKNKMRQTKPSDMKQTRILDKNSKGGESVEKGKESLKLREEADRNNLRKREHKSLMKSLTMA